MGFEEAEVVEALLLCKDAVLPSLWPVILVNLPPAPRSYLAT